MILIKLFFLVVGFFFFMTFVTGLSVFMRVRRHLQNPFMRPDASPAPPAGKGDIIEGEYKVLGEDEK
jgi:hypothetical protein